MRQRRVRRLCWGALAGFALAAVVALWISVGPRIRWRQVENAIRQSETASSQATVDTLGRVLRQGYPTPDQGRRILAFLFHPQVMTRRAYPAGRPPTVALQLPFKVHRMDPVLGGEMSLWADGKSTDTAYVGEHYLEGAYSILALDHPLRAGQTCEAQIRCHIEYLTPGRYNLFSRNPVVQGVVRNVVARFSRKLAVRIGGPKTKHYQCDFVVPVSLIAAAEGDEGKVALVSNPELDLSLRSDFASYPAQLGRSYSTKAGLLFCYGGVVITYPELPLAVAFRAALRLPDRRELRQYGEPIEPLRARTGAFGRFYINIADFVAPEAAGVRVPWIAGAYTGTLVLRPDPNLACDDPAIDAIWDGTLEFPIDFTITIEPDTAKQEQSTNTQ
jgi:hypothetical protein